MKKIHCLLCVIVGLLITSCNTLDDYDEPQEAIVGSVVDEVTNKPILTEQPKGFKMKMDEVSWSDAPRSEFFWGKADGTFKNMKIFKGTYEVSPVEGAFFPVDPVKIEIAGTVQIEFKVTPYLSIHVKDISVANGELKVTYTLSRAKVGDKIIDSRIFVSTNPYVGTNILINDLSPMKNLESMDDSEILKTTFTETIKGLENGKTYYVRVGARTNNAWKRYNFTETTKVDNP